MPEHDAPKIKSLFASFSSEKEESCSFLKKRTKRLFISDAAFGNLGPGRKLGLAVGERHSV
jgi:hypothetical protein